MEQNLKLFFKMTQSGCNRKWRKSKRNPGGIQTAGPALGPRSTRAQEQIPGNSKRSQTCRPVRPRALPGHPGACSTGLSPWRWPCSPASPAWFGRSAIPTPTHDPPTWRGHVLRLGECGFRRVLPKHWPQGFTGLCSEDGRFYSGGGCVSNVLR